MNQNTITIANVTFEDLVDILSIQKLAFQNEVETFNDYLIDPFIQSIESLEVDFKKYFYLKAVLDRKIIGSVRAYEKENVCYIGRLFVHPDYQGKGIGKTLMFHIEENFKHCTTYSLFAAKRVPINLQLYKSIGYSIVNEEKIQEGLTFVYFTKNVK